MSVAPSAPSETGAGLGLSIERKDGDEKMRGAARYVGDMTVPGMLHGKVLRSEVPAGRIRAVDVSAAEGMPGVRCVLVGADLRDLDPFYGHAILDRPVIAIEVERFDREPVAVVSADTEAQAEDAVRAIHVDYEPTEAAVDLDRALALDGPLVHTAPARGGAFHGLGNLPARLLPLRARLGRRRRRVRGGRRGGRGRLRVRLGLPVRDGDARLHRAGRG